MYSGTTFRDKSGRLMGVHQKIDRVARKHIETLLPEWCVFPSAKEILHFEGKNGPDGIKRKSPAVDEPWHFIDPSDPSDTRLLEMIDEHIVNLSVALQEGNNERASFEAAWMAHAITDGLTPAHHFPLEETLRQLRGGEGLETRDTFLKKGMMIGDTPIETLKNNWRFWGAKGAMTTHIAFETGVASVVAYNRFKTGIPTSSEVDFVAKNSFREYYLRVVNDVAGLKMYEKFIASGWTAGLAKQTNQILMPQIIRAVVLGWLAAVWRAENEA